MTEKSAQADAVQPVTHSTFSIDRSYPVPPARVFAAFSDKATKRR